MNQRKLQPKIGLNEKLDTNCFVDQLSPPPDLPDDYAMGLYHIETTNDSPLIEVRGYAKLLWENSEITIHNVKDFISKEAEWFFKQLRQGEG